MKGRIRRPESKGDINFQELGRVHIGMKSEKGYPMSIDYFRPTGKYAELFTKILGPKPQTITILFTSDEAERVCNERYEYRDNAGALVSYGDGEMFYVWDGKQYAPFLVKDYPDIMKRIVAKYPTKKGADGWEVTLRMQFLIPALSCVMCLWGFSTKGVASSIKNIRDSFDAVLALRGTVKGTAFDLSVQMHKSNKPGATSRYPVVTMVANDTRVQEIREMLKQKNDGNLLISAGK